MHQATWSDTVPEEAMAQAVFLRPQGASFGAHPADAARALRDLLQHRRAETETVFRMVAGLTTTLDLKRLLSYVVRLCAELTGCAGALVYLWDEDRERLVVRAAVEGYEQWVGRFSLAMGEGLTGWTALTRQPGIIRDNPRADPRFKYVPELRDDRFQSYLTVPVLSPAGGLLGVITMHTEAPHEFCEDDLILMNTVSALIGAAVENAQLYERQQRHAKALQALAGASNVAVQVSSLPHTLYRLAATAGELVTASHVAVLTLDPEETHLSLQTLWSAAPEMRGNPPSAVPVEHSWARLLGATTPLILNRRDDRDALLVLRSLVPKARAALVAPMKVSERPVGTFICCFETARSVGPEGQGLVCMIASQAALAVQNARLVEALTERNVVRDLFEVLMLGDEGDLGLEARAARLGVDLSRPHVVAAFEVGGRMADFEAARVWPSLRQDLSGAFPGSLAIDRDRTLTALVRLSEGTAPERLAQRLSEVKAHHERPPGVVISAGVSRVCRGAADYPDAFEQARHALLMGRVVRGPGAVVTFDELGAQWHLFSVAQQHVRDVYQERLERLLEQDRERGTQLFRTIEVYVETMGNAKLAARRLYVHRNTLRQRFEKIRRISGIDPSDRSRWFDLMMAVRIIRLRELSGAPGNERPAGNRDTRRR